MIEGLLSAFFPGAGAVAGAVGGLLTKGVSSWFNGRKEEKQAKIEADKAIQLERVKAENQIKITKQTGEYQIQLSKEKQNISKLELEKAQEQRKQAEQETSRQQEETFKATITQQDNLTGQLPVSYTHLTLPTILLV